MCIDIFYKKILFYKYEKFYKEANKMDAGVRNNLTGQIESIKDDGLMAQVTM